MDRNDYYGGESASLYLNEVLFIYYYYTIKFKYGFYQHAKGLYSFGSDLGVRKNPQNNWVQAENITLI